jgi:hypothetical protein
MNVYIFFINGWLLLVTIIMFFIENERDYCENPSIFKNFIL